MIFAWILVPFAALGLFIGGITLAMFKGFRNVVGFAWIGMQWIGIYFTGCWNTFSAWFRTTRVCVYVTSLRFWSHVKDCGNFLITPLGAIHAANAMIRGVTKGIRAHRANYPLEFVLLTYGSSKLVLLLEILVSGPYRRAVLDLFANTADMLDLIIDKSQRSYNPTTGKIEKDLSASFVDTLVENLRNAADHSVSILNYTWTAEKSVSSAFEVLGILFAYYILDSPAILRRVRLVFTMRPEVPVVANVEVPPPNYDEVNKPKPNYTSEQLTADPGFVAQDSHRKDRKIEVTQDAPPRAGIGFVTADKGKYEELVPQFGTVEHDWAELRAAAKHVPTSDPVMHVAISTSGNGASSSGIPLLEKPKSDEKQIELETKFSKVPEEVRDTKERRKLDKQNAGEAWNIVEPRKGKARNAPIKTNWKAGTQVEYKKTMIPLEDYKYVKSIFLGFAEELAKTDNRIKPQNFATTLIRSYIAQFGAAALIPVDQATVDRYKGAPARFSDSLRDEIANRIIPSMYSAQWKKYIDDVFKHESLIIGNQPFDTMTEVIEVRSEFEDGEIPSRGSVHIFEVDGKRKQGLVMKRHGLFRDLENETKPKRLLVRSNRTHAPDSWVTVKDWQVVSWDKEFDTIVVFAGQFSCFKPLPLAPEGDYKDVEHYVSEGTKVCSFRCDEATEPARELLSSYSTLGHGSSGSPIFVVDTHGRTCVRGWHTGSAQEGKKSAWMPISVLRSKNSPFLQGSSG